MSSESQRKIIIGLEAAPGDGAAPDVALRATASFEAKVDKIVVKENVGSYAPQRHYIGSKMAEGKLEMTDAYYEGAPFLISMAMGAGGVSGASDPWTWTWTLPDGTAPTWATYRLEYTDGNNHIIRSDDTFAKGMEIKGEAGKGVAIIDDIVGGSVTFPAALGASLTPLATPTQIRMAETGLEMEDDYDDLGAANVTVMHSFSWKLENLQLQLLRANSLYPNGRSNDEWRVTLKLVVEIDDAKIESEKDKLLTTTQTAIQIKSSASANDSLTISGMYFLKELKTLDSRNGVNIVEMTYMAEKGSEGDLPNIVVVTNLSAL